MIWSTWQRISYMVQVLTACWIFILPAKKCRWFPFRAIAGFFFWVLIAWYLSGRLNSTGQDNTSGFFWSVYLVCAIIYLWDNLQTGLVEAVFCGVMSCGIQHIAFNLCTIVQFAAGRLNEIPGLPDGTAMVLIYMVVYYVGYRCLASRIAQRDRSSIEGQKARSYPVSTDAFFPLITMMFLVWVFSVLELSPIPGFEAGIGSHIIYRILDSLCCFYVLWVQMNQNKTISLQRELDGINAAARQQELQYRTTEAAIDSINRKCHDLKHQVRSLRKYTDEEHFQAYIDEIEKDVMIYDTAVQTGNKALDTVLMEKGLFCQEHDIQWTCMVNGSKLSFMKIEDIYAIFGNALDNAVEAVLCLAEKEKRVISVQTLEQNQLLLIQIRNYYDQELHFENGLPLTTKSDKTQHGYGMKSIRHIVETYDGILTVQAQDGIFMLQILLPVETAC